MQRTVVAPDVSAEAVRLDIPYLGPVPGRSRPWGRAVLVAAALTALVRLGVAATCWAQAGLFDRIADGERGADLVRSVEDHDDTLAALRTVALVLLVVTIALELVWRERRRPRRTLRELGEAHVESPIGWILSPRTRAVVTLAVALSVGIASSFSVQADMTAAEAVDAYRATALLNVGWAAFWAWSLWIVLRCDRALEERIEASSGARRRPADVPHFAAVSERGTMQIGTPSGGFWVLRTAALVVAAVACSAFVAGGISELLGGNTGGVLWFAGGVVGDAIVVRAFVRRSRRGRTPV